MHKETDVEQCCRNKTDKTEESKLYILEYINSALGKGSVSVNEV